MQLNAWWLSPSCLISGALLRARSVPLPGERDDPTRPSVTDNEVPAFFLSSLVGWWSEVEEQSGLCCGSRNEEPF